MAIEQDGKGRSDGKAIRFEAAAAASPSPTYENLFLLPSPEAEEGTAATAAAAARVSKDATMAKLGGSLGIENSEVLLSQLQLGCGPLQELRVEESTQIAIFQRVVCC